MAEMTIRVEMNNDDKSVIISNDDKTVRITNEKKEINAEDIYSLLKYEEGNTYSVENNLDDMREEKDKEYLNDIVNLINEIKDDINSLVDIEDEDTTESEADDYIEEEIEDFPENDEQQSYDYILPFYLTIFKK